MKRFSRGRCIGFTLLLLFLSCSLGDECDHEARDWARLERMEDEIHALIGDPLCSDSTDCRFIAFGSKACGGPRTYLIYSISTVDTVELSKRVREHNEYEALLNRRYGVISTCGVPNPPDLGCRDGRCVDLGYGR